MLPQTRPQSCGGTRHCSTPVLPKAAMAKRGTVVSPTPTLLAWSPLNAQPTTTCRTVDLCANRKTYGNSSFPPQILLSSPHLSSSSLCSLVQSFTSQCFPQNLSPFVDLHCSASYTIDMRFVLIGLPLASFSIFPNVMRHTFQSPVYSVFVVFFAVAPSQLPYLSLARSCCLFIKLIVYR